MSKQQFFLRSEQIRANCQAVIAQLPTDSVKPLAGSGLGRAFANWVELLYPLAVQGGCFPRDIAKAPCTAGVYFILCLFALGKKLEDGE